MKKVIFAVLALAVLVLALTILFQKILRREPATKVANRLVELINAADYSGVEGLFNKEVSQRLPLEKTIEFLQGLSAQVGRLQNLAEPEKSPEGMVFLAHCERGTLDMTLALDEQNKVAGLVFKPHVDGRYAKVANRLVELINAADYSGVESLFNKEMSQGLPLEKAIEFFQGLSAQVGRIQNLAEPEKSPEGMVFPAHCERGVLDMTLGLDEQNKIAGLLFKPHVDKRYTTAANRLVELINAADYSGVEGLFNKEMSGALPLEKATAFFKGLNAQVGSIQ